MEKENERRRKFFPSITLGNILTICTIAIAGFGVYSQLYADVEKGKVEIVNLKAEQLKLERQAENTRTELRTEIREFNRKLDRINDKLDRVIEEPPVVRPMRRGVERN